MLLQRRIPFLSQGGGGGGALAGFINHPVYREVYARGGGLGNFPWSAGALVTGDYVVGAAAGYAYGGASTIGGTDAPVTEDPLSTNDDETVGSGPYQWAGNSLYHVQDADTQNGFDYTFTGSNGVGSFTSVGFIGGTVGDTPTLIEDGYIDTVIASSWTLSTDDIQFPVHEVPAGWTYVYTVVRGDDPDTTVTWGVADHRGSVDTLAGSDLMASVATLDGPHSGEGVYMRQADNSVDVPVRGAFCSIVAVPGKDGLLDAISFHNPGAGLSVDVDVVAGDRIYCVTTDRDSGTASAVIPSNGGQTADWVALAGGTDTRFDTGGVSDGAFLCASLKIDVTETLTLSSVSIFAFTAMLDTGDTMGMPTTQIDFDAAQGAGAGHPTLNVTAASYGQKVLVFGGWGNDAGATAEEDYTSKLTPPDEFLTGAFNCHHAFQTYRVDAFIGYASKPAADEAWEFTLSEDPAVGFAASGWYLRAWDWGYGYQA